jgi:hypothetical protein
MDQHLMYVAGTRHTTDLKIHAEESYEICQLHKTQNKPVSTDYIGVTRKHLPSVNLLKRRLKMRN